jgi:hypothetical protein
MAEPPITVTDRPVPTASALAHCWPATDFTHAASGPLAPGGPQDPRYWADLLFSDPPAVVRKLIGARDTVARAIRLHTVHPGTGAAAGDRIGPFPLISRGDTEVVFGLDDKHLDFRSAVLIERAEGSHGNATVTVSTVARAHNTFGRLYLRPVIAAHPAMLRLLLRRALRRFAQVKPLATPGCKEDQ